MADDTSNHDIGEADFDGDATRATTDALPEGAP